MRSLRGMTQRLLCTVMVSNSCAARPVHAQQELGIAKHRKRCLQGKPPSPCHKMKSSKGRDSTGMLLSSCRSIPVIPHAVVSRVSQKAMAAAVFAGWQRRVGLPKEEQQEARHLRVTPPCSWQGGVAGWAHPRWTAGWRAQGTPHSAADAPHAPRRLSRPAGCQSHLCTKRALCPMHHKLCS